MFKDFDLKNDPQYHSGHLRGRIHKAIKHMRDETEELKVPSAKQMPIIPITGSADTHKYMINKSFMKFP